MMTAIFLSLPDRESAGRGRRTKSVPKPKTTRRTNFPAKDFARSDFSVIFALAFEQWRDSSAG
ncbi:hypothetical protein [uncultured Alistipes sp.]|uniref:hypothetical protein n=1 Tax=uncultured Alistipes sp. TaxID=538949 RepID=UPI00272DABBA|nr:hypothetical protein [uncultured Alistipes sp.]